MASYAGHWPAASITARPAEKGIETQGLDPALMRKSVDGIVGVTGCRRKEARAQVNAWLSSGKSLGDLAYFLEYADPTGEIACGFQVSA